MSSDDLRLRQAFPAYLTQELDQLLSRIDFDSRLSPTNSSIASILGSEQVKIPMRVYFDRDFAVGNLTLQQRIRGFVDPDYRAPQLPLTQQTLYACLYTRHHNGYQREAALRMLFELNMANIEWVVPFVVQLAAEYVENILLIIDRQLVQLNKTSYRNFLLANPEYFYKTKQRIRSYWDCYYRRQQPDFTTYVGGRITAYFDGLLK